jgi:hypothetical protein
MAKNDYFYCLTHKGNYNNVKLRIPTVMGECTISGVFWSLKEAKKLKRYCKQEHNLKTEIRKIRMVIQY